MLATILAKIGIGKLLFGSGLAVGIVIALAKKYIPDYIGKWFAGELQKALNPDLTDPVEKEKYIIMVKGICGYVEHKIPDNPGVDKFHKVKELLMRFTSEKYAHEIVAIVAEAVKRMNDELKKQS